LVVLLDGTSTGTRTGRWLKAVTPQSILRFLSATSVAAVPLAFLVAQSYARGRASYYGIPPGLVRVGLTDAISPFVIIAGLGWFVFIVLHEVERVGLVKFANAIGSTFRIMFIVPLLVGVLIAQIDNQVQESGLVVTLIVYAMFLILAYLLLWWVPPAIAWIGHWVGRTVASQWNPPYRPGRFALHMFRGLLDYSRWPRELAIFMFSAIALLALLGAVPIALGWVDAQDTEDYAVVKAAGGDRQVVLAIYGDKAFMATVEGQHIRTITIRQTADLKDMEVSIEHLGSLRPVRPTSPW
jgi:hypothetical protein